MTFLCCFAALEGFVVGDHMGDSIIALFPWLFDLEQFAEDENSVLSPSLSFLPKDITVAKPTVFCVF